jgi:hypothetical protein
MALISGKFRQQWLKTNSLLDLLQSLVIWNHPAFFSFLFTYLFFIACLYYLLSF